MKNFEITWKLIIVGLLIAIITSLQSIKFKIIDIEKLLNVPDIELPQYEESK